MQPTEAWDTLNPQPEVDTTAWRIFHDVTAGVWVDHFDGHWLVQTRENRFPEYLKGLAQGVASSIHWRPRDKAASTAPERVWGEMEGNRFSVVENGAKFWIDFDSGYSSGIFLDQRLNRRRVAANSRGGQRILNTFAYTGGFSVMAALSGATTTTVDLSKTCLNWTWDNLRLNDLDPEAHHGVRGDAIDWLEVFAKKGRRFHGIVLDPPTFSRSGKKIFRTDSNYADLAALAAGVLEPGGWMLCCANTHRLGLREFKKDVFEGISRQGRSVVSCDTLAMSPEFRGDDYLKSLWVVVG